MIGILNIAEGRRFASRNPRADLTPGAGPGGLGAEFQSTVYDVDDRVSTHRGKACDGGITCDLAMIETSEATRPGTGDRQPVGRIGAVDN
jgi:hypothetical protein